VSELEPSVETDAAAIEAEGERIERERLQAALALQQAHSSRLAGEIGHLRKQLEAIPKASEPFEPQSPEEMDRLSRLEQAFSDSEARRGRIEVAQAVESAISVLDVADVVGPIQAEISQVAPKYKEQFEAARQVTDPGLARQMADAIGRSVIADAKELAWTNRRKTLLEKQAAQAKDLVARKKAATVSGSGTTSTSRPAPKTYDQMTSEELDAEMEKEFGRR
jgi:hypothetical protein